MSKFRVLVLLVSALPILIVLIVSFASISVADLSDESHLSPAVEAPFDISQPAPFIDRYDPAGEIRSAVGESRAESHLAWLRANVAFTESIEQTVVDTVDAAMKLDWGADQRDGERRTKIGEWAMLAAGQVVEDRFPGETGLSSSGPFDPTPIERYCNCLRESARPCGCDVSSFGAGTCEFTPSCPGYFQGSCYYGIAVNMCAAESIIGIISPVK